MRRNVFAGALLRAALLSSSFIVFAPLLAQNAAPQQPVDQNHGTAPRQESGPSVSENVAPDLGPETARATAEAARRYMEIAARGGWPRLVRPLHPGAKGGDVARLRRRLGAEGYLSEDASGGSDWDEGLTDAIKRFQANHGLDQTGDVSRATLRELNIPAAARAKQLEATARRVSRLRFHFPRKYVAVNIRGRVGRGGRGRQGGSPLHGDRRRQAPQVAANHGEDRLRRYQSDVDRAGFDHQKGDRAATAPRSQLSRAPAYSRARRSRPRGRPAKIAPPLDDARRAFHVPPGPRREKRAWLATPLDAQQKRSLHARHAAETTIRSRLPVPVARLCARGRSLRSRGVAFERLGHGLRAMGQREAAKRDRQADGPRKYGLCIRRRWFGPI